MPFLLFLFFFDNIIAIMSKLFSTDIWNYFKEATCADDRWRLRTQLFEDARNLQRCDNVLFTIILGCVPWQSNRKKDSFFFHQMSKWRLWMDWGTEEQRGEHWNIEPSHKIAHIRCTNKNLTWLRGFCDQTYIFNLVSFSLYQVCCGN